MLTAAQCPTQSYLVSHAKQQLALTVRRIAFSSINGAPKEKIADLKAKERYYEGVIKNLSEE